MSEFWNTTSVTSVQLFGSGVFELHKAASNLFSLFETKQY